MRILFGVLIFAASSTWALTPFKQSLTVKKNAYMADGVFTGGEAGSGITLLNVRHVLSKKATVERLIFDVGDRDGKPNAQRLGYFQASVDSKQNRITLDLAQLRLTSVSEQKLKTLFKKSPYIASIEFTLDPEDKAGTLVLNLKRPMQLEVFQMLENKKPARIVMDLTPVKQTRVKGHI